jgi:ribonuclease BN (tRNA processing enzyme)
LIIDAGTGVSRLMEEPSLLEGVANVDVVLTHFHLDHVVGLAYLPALPVSNPPRLHGPGQWLYGAPTEEILGRLVGAPLFGLTVQELVSEVQELHDGELSVGPFRVRARVQTRHDDPTVAFRVEDELAYCTDTSYDEGNVEFARGSRRLLHEAWYTEDAPQQEATHSSARMAAEVAGEAGVDRLVLIHVRPGGDERRLEEEARSVFPPAVVGTDLLHA